MRVDVDVVASSRPGDPDIGLLAAEVRRLSAALDDATAEITRLRVKAERLRLTDTERRVLVTVRHSYELNDDDEDCARIAATVDDLLARHADQDAAPE